MTVVNPAFYSNTIKGTWKGRTDGTDPASQRWHQRILTVNLLEELIPVAPSGERNVALIGFACDEGVLRNGGRVGAKDGPLCFRQACGNLPVHLAEEALFIDLGDIICETEAMEEAQTELANLVETALFYGYQPLVIGGGHEIAYGHYKGISNHIDDTTTIGIINFDAHFDLREPTGGLSTSGTGFFEIAVNCRQDKKPFHYLVLGIQQNSNTRQLYQTATQLSATFIPAREFCTTNEQEILSKVEKFIQGCSHIYLTIDLDVFAASVAPGVSAPAYSGLFPDPFFFKCLQFIIDSKKIISMDIAEYNPGYDPDHRTAKLAAALAFNLVTG
ncbi:formimidoylglutamase [Pedobacter hartonius]|uniref:Formimidoylglutamase n=1 Tax=Pedobacter hartonius TaxID=425514 RepID=A0A1H4CUN9_9SPHI|nr:formimidoylglutamase [Pedobacter hartonius]SEA64143.1 formiminoglutamase [Pedobacter hartonius]